MWAESNKRNQNGKESEHVQDQDESLELGQCGTDKCVDKDGKYEDGPEEQRAMPQLWHETVVVQSCHAENHVTSEQSARRDGTLPAADGQPSGHIAQKLGTGARREHCYPMVLSTRCWGHRGQLAHGCEDTEIASPHDEKAVDHTRGTAIVEALSEEHGNGLPSNKDSAAEAKNRREAEVALGIASATSIR